MQALPPRSQHTHTIILLHGRGSTAKEFAEEFFESQTSDGRTLQDVFPYVRWVFPQAPRIDAGRFGMDDMAQWFDMWSTEDVHEREEEDGQGQELEGAVARVREVLAREVAVVGARRVVLGGISQGCAVGVHVLLGQRVQLGGFVGFCGWVPKAAALEEVVVGEGREAVKTPVLLGHAKDDSVIDIRFGEELRDCLRRFGMAVRWERYEDGGHWFNEPRGIDDLVGFLQGVFEEATS